MSYLIKSNYDLVIYTSSEGKVLLELPQVVLEPERPALPPRCCGHCDEWDPGKGLVSFGGKMAPPYGVCRHSLRSSPKMPGSCITTADQHTKCSDFKSSSRCPQCFEQFDLLVKDHLGRIDTSKCRNCGWSK